MRCGISWLAVGSAVIAAVLGFLLAAAIGLPGSPFDVRSSALWAAWVQAVGSIAAILVAAAVPTALYLQQRRSDQRKELANAKISIAFALDGLVTAVWNLGHVSFDPDDPQEFMAGLKEIIEATDVPDSFLDALRKADSYPSLIDDMAKYLKRAQGLNIRASFAVRHVGTKNGAGNSSASLMREVAELEAIGERLMHRMMKIQYATIH